MDDSQGLFIVLEGADGAGKSTQFKLLKERLRAVGYEVETFHFPRYEKTSSHFVQRYLNGGYGPADSVSPYTAALFFALDRYEAAPAIRSALAAGKIVLTDRYVGSNMAHQGCKFKEQIEQRGFFIWLDGLEFQLLGIPRPSTSLYLKVPAEISHQQIGQKAQRQYTKAQYDEHEKNIQYLREAIAAFDTLCELFPKDFQTINCTKEGKILSVAAINDEIWKRLKPMLPPKAPHAGHDIVVNLNENNNEQSKTAEESKHQAKKSLPRHQIMESGKIINLSVNKTSLLALTQVQDFPNLKSRITSIEWSQDETYEFYTPSELPKGANNIYKDAMRKQMHLHQRMIKSASQNSILTEELKACTPLSALASLKISGPPNEFIELFKQLQLSPLAETKWLMQQLLAAVRKLYPQYFQTVKAIEETQFNIQKQPQDIITKLVSEHLPHTLPPQDMEVILLEARPRNEFDLLPDSLYSYSTVSRSDIAADIETWPYEQKEKALLSTASQPSTQVLQHAQYWWNIICDRPVFDQLRKVVEVKDIKTQPTTPRFGYDVPQVVEENGLDELYMDCFDESLKLFSGLQVADREDLAGYATLLGHKNRWQFTTTADALRLAKKAQNPRVSILLDAMYEKISEAHPLISDLVGFNEEENQKTKNNSVNNRPLPGSSRPKLKKRTPRSKK